MKIIVYKTRSFSLRFLLLSLASVLICFGQEDNRDNLIDTIVSKVQRLAGDRYYISAINIDNPNEDPTVFNPTVRDKYHTLTGCILFIAYGVADEDLNKPKPFIGIYKIKMDSIIWQSKLLPEDFSGGALGSVDLIDELNSDGKVEIIISQAKGSLANLMQLWVFNWDGENGKLITQVDEDGESEIWHWGESFSFRDIDGDGIYEIQGKWEKGDGTDMKVTITYAWNGSLYGKWGKTSKYLLRGKKK